MDKLPISWRGRPAPARRGFEVARVLERGGAVVVLIRAAEIADTDIMPRLLSQLREPAQSPKTKDCCPVPARAEISKFREI